VKQQGSAKVAVSAHSHRDCNSHEASINLALGDSKKEQAIGVEEEERPNTSSQMQVTHRTLFLF